MNGMNGMNGKKIGGRCRALFLAAILVAAMTVEVFAASTTKTLPNYGNSLSYATITTGKGFSYSMGWKKTTVTVKNVGTKTIGLYSNLGRLGYRWDANLAPGQTRTYTASGSGAQYSLQFQRIYSSGTNRVQITTSAGSVW